MAWLVGPLAVVVLLGLRHVALGLGALILWAAVRAWRSDLRPAGEEGELVVDDQALRFGGEGVSLSALRGATWRLDARHGPLVELRRGLGRHLRFAVATPQIARAIVEAVGADPRRRRAVFPALSPVVAAHPVIGIGVLLATLLAVPVAAVWALGGPAPAWAGLLALLALLVIVVTHQPRRVDVGSDAVVVRWLGTRRVVPLARIVSVVPFGQEGRAVIGAELRLDDGTVERLPMERGTDGPVETGRFIERVRDASAIRDDAGGVGHGALARGGRTPLAWVTALRALGAGGGAGHRSAATSREALVATVRDTRSAPVLRAAAAVALRERGEGAHDDLVDVAASTAQPALRIALTRAASADASAEALAEALAAVEAEQDEHVARRRR